MTEKNDQEPKKTLTLKTLSLKKASEGDQVRQNFSHGRSKTVAVEVKKKRILAPADSAKQVQDEKLNALQGEGAKLTGGELQTRMRVLQEAYRQEALQQAQREEEERQEDPLVQPELSAPVSQQQEAPIEEVVEQKEVNVFEVKQPQSKELPKRFEIKRPAPKKIEVTSAPQEPVVYRAGGDQGKKAPAKPLKAQDHKHKDVGGEDREALAKKMVVRS